MPTVSHMSKCMVCDACAVFFVLQECNQQLEVVEKGLNQFLETKKMAFPRCSMFNDAVTWVVGCINKSPAGPLHASLLVHVAGGGGQLHNCH